MTSDEYKGIVLSVENLVDYQEDSVVSKQIIKKDIGNVTLFAFDEGEGLSEHTAPYDALVIVLDGVAQVMISGKPMRVGKEEMVLMPADKPHSLKAVQRFKMLLVMIKA